MSRTVRANALRERIRAALDDAFLPDVIVTVDPLEAANGREHGAVVILAPALEFTTWNQTEETWTLHVVIGPKPVMFDEWDALDDIITALQSASINLATGEPQDFAVITGEAAWPGYALTLTPDTVFD